MGGEFGCSLRTAFEMGVFLWEVEREDPDRIVVVVLSEWSLDRLCCSQ